MPETPLPHGNLPPLPERWKPQYRCVETPRWRAWLDRSLEGDGVERWLDDPAALFDAHLARWLKRGRNRLGEVGWPAGAAGPATVVLKEYGTRGAIGKARSFMRPGRPLRAWHNAFALLERGIATPRPLWIALPRSGGRSAASFLAVETASPHTRLRELLKQLNAGKGEIVMEGDDPVRLAPEAFLGLLGRYVRRMHDAGVWHRDFSGGNLLIPHAWRPGGEATAPWILIDVNRCRFCAPGALELGRRLQDLERISLEPARREAFFEAYAEGDPALAGARERYLRCAADYRRLRRTRNPLARLWRKVFTYWLRAR